MAYFETGTPAKAVKGYNNKKLTEGVHHFRMVNPNPTCPYKSADLKEEFYSLSKDQLKVIIAEGNRAKWELVRRMLADEEKDTKNFVQGIGFVCLVIVGIFALHTLGII